jgi:spore coat protein U-like protein
MRTTSLRVLLAAVLAALPGVAFAGGTHTIAVSASVTGNCKIVDSASTLDFGALDPATGGTVNATWSGGLFSCTKGQAYTVASNDGLWESSTGGANNRMKLSTASDCSTATDCVRYTLAAVTSGTGAGHGSGNRISFAVTGQTTLLDYQDASVGSYSDTVVLTVAP